MFNKNDPLISSVTKVMQENQIRRNVVSAINEAFGITDKRHLPFQAHAEYDALVEEMTQEALVGGQAKLDVNRNNRLDKQDFKMLRGMKKKPMEEESLDEISKKLAGKYTKAAADDLADKTDPNYGYMTDKDEDQVERETENRRKGIGRAVKRLTKEEDEFYSFLESLSEEELNNLAALDEGVLDYVKDRADKVASAISPAYNIGKAAVNYVNQNGLAKTADQVATAVAPIAYGGAKLAVNAVKQDYKNFEAGRNADRPMPPRTPTPTQPAPAAASSPTSQGAPKPKDFKSSFADARKSGAKEFTWNGKKYNTKLKEATLSAKAARAGKDIGKKGKMFAKIAASAAKRYGSEERGKKVAGAILKKMRAKAGMEEEVVQEAGIGPAGAPGGAAQQQAYVNRKRVQAIAQTQNPTTTATVSGPVNRFRKDFGPAGGGPQDVAGRLKVTPPPALGTGPKTVNIGGLNPDAAKNAAVARMQAQRSAVRTGPDAAMAPKTGMAPKPAAPKPVAPKPKVIQGPDGTTATMTGKGNDAIVRNKSGTYAGSVVKGLGGGAKIQNFRAGGGGPIVGKKD